MDTIHLLTLHGGVEASVRKFANPELMLRAAQHQHIKSNGEDSLFALYVDAQGDIQPFSFSTSELEISE